MTLPDELMILDDKIKANQAQFDSYREAAKFSALPSKELDKYEYLTGEDLGYKPGVVERPTFEYSPLGEVLSDKFKKINKTTKPIKQLKTPNKTKLWFIINSIVFQNLKNFKELSLDSMQKKLNKFHKKFTMFKKRNPQTKEKEDLKVKVLDDVVFGTVFCLPR